VVEWFAGWSVDWYWVVLVIGVVGLAVVETSPMIVVEKSGFTF
jgi:hypothetical protein